MIKSDFGKVEVKGDKILIMTEVSSLLRVLQAAKILTKEELIKSIEKAFESDEEIEKNANEILRNMTLSEKLGLIEDIEKLKKSRETEDKNVKTIFEDEDVSTKEVNINTNEESEKQIKQELKNALDEIFKK